MEVLYLAMVSSHQSYHVVWSDLHSHVQADEILDEVVWPLQLGLIVHIHLFKFKF